MRNADDLVAFNLLVQIRENDNRRQVKMLH